MGNMEHGDRTWVWKIGLEHGESEVYIDLWGFGTIDFPSPRNTPTVPGAISTISFCQLLSEVNRCRGVGERDNLAVVRVE